jgi:glyoxylase-like metal-dependent hydrolase (beta-lactamase superfamily II)
MKINDHLALLDIKAWGDNSLYLAVLFDQESAALFDTALPGSLPYIREAMICDRLPFEKINRIFITHHDFDHIGGLPELLAGSYQKIEVLAHPLEQPHIEGCRPPIKSEPDIRAQMQRNLPAGQILAPAHPIKNPPCAPVDRLLSDGQYLDLCGGITVIHVPGHTPGHLCYYLNASKTLIAGDALRAIDGHLQLPAPEHSVDIHLAVTSLKKLLKFDIEKIICCHGGLCSDNVREQLHQLTAKF